jgi:hypothetical protein
MNCPSVFSVKTNVYVQRYILRYAEMPPPFGKTMVNPEQLSVARGQLGPICAGCDLPLTFAESLVIDDRYYCLECYEKITGISSSTEPKEVDGLRMD